MATTKQNGARIYFYTDGVTLVKQTVKSGNSYVIDTDTNGRQRERHVNPGDDRALGEAVRLAGEGKL